MRLHYMHGEVGICLYCISQDILLRQASPPVRPVASVSCRASVMHSAGLQRWKHLFLPSLAQDSVCLYAHAFHRVDHHQSAVAQPRSSADLAAEVHMPRRVYEVD